MIDIRCPECAQKLLDAPYPESTIDLEVKCAKCKSIIAIQLFSTGYETRTKTLGRLVGRVGRKPGEVWKPTDYKGE